MHLPASAPYTLARAEGQILDQNTHATSRLVTSAPLPRDCILWKPSFNIVQRIIVLFQSRLSIHSSWVIISDDSLNFY